MLFLKALAISTSLVDFDTVYVHSNLRIHRIQIRNLESEVDLNKSRYAWEALLDCHSLK